MDTPSPSMQDPSFRFDWGIEAARKNWETLEKFDLNIHRAIASQAHSHTCFGSEFCKVDLLQPLLSYHPLWPRLVTLLTMGVAFPLKPLTEDQRLKDLDLAIARWNHSSARLKSPIVKTLLLKKSHADGNHHSHQRKFASFHTMW